MLSVDKASAEARGNYCPEGGQRARARSRLGKRVLDVLLATAILLALYPLLLFITLMILVTDGRPVLYEHPRVGHRNRSFRCLKFRTMIKDADRRLEEILRSDSAARAEWQRDQKLRRDPRILRPSGAFLRRTSLDELPQLFNVLRGDMSLVGPRPVTRQELQFYGGNLEYYFRARPGITGPWQISGRNDTSFEERVHLDVTYVRSGRLRDDLVILLRTPLVVLTGRGAY
jgi:exopolysaccharide production protein ExoY